MSKKYNNRDNEFIRFRSFMAKVEAQKKKEDEALKQFKASAKKKDN